jgi:hypothetical protein
MPADMGQGGFQGGCFCGGLRYAAQAEPLWSGYCHCRMCQRTTGAPVLAWASFAVESFGYLKGSPAIYRSSAAGQREFCPTCGTQIAFRQDDAPTLEINLGSLDEPASIEPRVHIFTASRIPWFETADALPRFEDAGPVGDAP